MLSRILLLVGGLTLSAVALGQAIPSLPNIGRVNEIWRIADNRMSRQADYWFEHGDLPRAAQLVGFRAAVYPNDYERVTDYGFLLKSLDRRNEELAVYIQFRQSNLDKDPDAAWPEANFYYEMKMYAKVSPLLEPTLTRNPHPNSFRLLARAYEKAGSLQNALRIYQALVVSHPEDGAAKANVERIKKMMRAAGIIVFPG